MQRIVYFVLLMVIVPVYGNLLSLRRLVRADCFCHANECCSKWGYCGKTDDYCGVNCQSGPCKYRQKKILTSFEIKPNHFQCVFPHLDAQLRSRRFDGFRQAMKEMKWKPGNAVEAAIFLAHVSHETDGLKTLVEYCSQAGTCNNYQSSWCSINGTAGFQYYGRGWFQLSYPCNYYNAGQAMELDLLNQPDLVSQSEVIAAATAIWYFKETGMNQLAQQGSFANTTRKLNEYECLGKAGYHMQTGRVKTYQFVRSCFSLGESKENLLC